MAQSFTKKTHRGTIRAVRDASSSSLEKP